MRKTLALEDTQVSEQIPKSVDQVPKALERLSQMVDRTPWVEGAIEIAGDSDGGGVSGFNLPSHLLGVFSTTLGAIATVSLIVLIAIYFTFPRQLTYGTC